jgi:hypothetical protein
MTVTPRPLPRLALVLLAAALAPAAARAAEPQPVQTPNYKQATKYSDDFLRQFVYDTAVRPNWIGKTDLFWYSYRTSAGTRYWKVNSKQRSKDPLFDAVKLGTQLSEALQKPLDHQRLPLERVALDDEGAKMTFVAEEWRFEYDLAADKLTKLGKAPPLPAAPGPNATAEERRRFFEQLQQRQQDQQQQQRGGGRRGGEGFAGRGGRGGGDFRAFSPDRKAYVYA